MEYKSDVTIHIPEDITLPEFVLQKAASFGDRLALIDENDGRQFTYIEFVSACRRLARGLYHQGIRRGDVIAVLAPNCIEYPILFYGVMLCGAVVTGVNAASTTGEITERLLDANVKYVFTTGVLYSRLMDARTTETNIRDVFLLGQPHKGHTTYQQLQEHGDQPLKLDVNPSTDCCTLNYSSGTSGRCKGVVHSHYNYIAQILQLRQPSVMSVRDGCDVTLIQRPLFHAYAQVYHVALGCYQGMTQVISPDLAPQTTLDLIKKYKVTFLAMTPFAVSSLVQWPGIASSDTSSLRTVLSSASPLSPGLIRATRETLGAPDVRNVFGMTEVLLATSPKENEKTHTVGTVMANVAAKILDLDTGKTLNCKQSGELVIKAPTVCAGYHNRPDADSASFTHDGWFRTGDLGYFDEVGNCHIYDRLKELIHYGPGPSIHIAPAEVEGVILEHPGVKQVAVVGKPDPAYPQWVGNLPVSELTTAFIIKKAGHDVTEIDICNWVAERMSDGNELRGGVVFVEQLPMSSSGKLLRRRIRDQLRAEAQLAAQGR